jgi:hypothetical protein
MQAIRDLAVEILRRRDADQAARSALLHNDPEAVERVTQIDDQNAAWLSEVVDEVGWPGRSLVGESGAHAAWLLAQHADRYPRLQQRCLTLMKDAVALGEASPADLAYLTDRVLLAKGKLQIYGTQIIARDRRFIASRLSDPETVDIRRAAVGLEALEAYLSRALDSYGLPKPAQMPCPSCHSVLEVWLPELGGRSIVKCPSCLSVATIWANVRSAEI